MGTSRDADTRTASRGDWTRAPSPRTEEPGVLASQLETTRKQLEQSEARFKDVIEHNADAIVVVDPSGAIRFANLAAAELFAVARESLIGSPFGFPLVAGATTEVEVLRPDGQRVAEMRVVQSHWDGADAQIASLRDITARKRAETDARRLVQTETARVAAHKSARRFRFLADAGEALSSSLDMSATLDTLARMCVRELADWVVIYGTGHQVTRTHVRHRDPARAASARALRAIPIEHGAHPVLDVLKSRRSRLEREVSDSRLTAMTTPAELALVRELGLRSYLLVPIVAREHPLGAIALMRGQESRPFDADDLALAEQIAARAGLAMDNARLYDEANRANQTKADFLAVVSHDLRTPLSAILGYSDLLLLGMPDPLPAGSRERVERIKASAKHVSYLLNELLSFARLDAGREELRPQLVDLREVVREVQTVVEPLAERKGLLLEFQLPESAARVSTDPDKIRQILLNLVGNAVKYTDRGHVRVQLLSIDNRVEVRVSDTGRGIPAQYLDRIFEPFWQIDSTQRSHGGGTGLGLSVVKRLTALLGGRIEVTSEVGAGSQFTLSLPGPQSHAG